MRIDHVIYAAADLDAAAERVERELGLKVEGGRHDGRGTQNRVVPLGGGYLELLAVTDRAQASGSDVGRALLDRLRTAGDGLLGWVVGVDDIEPVASRLGTQVTTIRRADLSARLTGIAEAMRSPYLPFFLSRDPGSPDPGAGTGAGGISWVEVAGDAGRLKDWLGGADLPVRVVDGPAGVRAVGIGGRELRS